MVPSWTETLIHADVPVIGRTRFCIHPKNLVRDIPIVGGTKDWNLDKIESLNPDLLILDREENSELMSLQTKFDWHASHIQNLSNLPRELSVLAQKLEAPVLQNFSQRWQNLISLPPQPVWKGEDSFPGMIRWGQKPTVPIQKILYVIWRNPWMVVSRDTFIGSVLELLGIHLPKFETKYPKIQLEDFDPSSNLLLFSSEPYPFLKKARELESLPNPYAFVDGESFSWFGIRSLHFLERAFKIPPLPLVPGEDYEMDGKLMVFTRKYHLKKGYCCENNCRHCPYR